MRRMQPADLQLKRVARVGRYLLFDELASGGMGAVHFARLDGPAGICRCVVVKRLHPHLIKNADFVAMFLDEARLATRVRHPNVVSALDVVKEGSDLLLVMEYVHGESLARLLRLARANGRRLPPPIVSSIMIGVLRGLHGAHETRNETGQPLGLVHRDVSPQNVMVGVDGIARLLDFGVAKAAGRIHTTRSNSIKGKVGYMAPEQLASDVVTRQSDLYSTAVVLWEALTGERMFHADSEGNVLTRILLGEVQPPSSKVPEVARALDVVVLKGLARERSDRFANAREMASALSAACPPASEEVVGEYVEHVAQDDLAARAARVRAIESRSPSLVPATAKAIIEDVVANERPLGAGERLPTPSGPRVHAPTTNHLDVSTVSASRGIVHVRQSWRLWPALGAIAAAIVLGGSAVASSWHHSISPATGASITIAARFDPVATASATMAVTSAEPDSLIQAQVDAAAPQAPPASASPPASAATPQRPRPVVKKSPGVRTRAAATGCRTIESRDAEGIIRFQYQCN